MIFLLGLLKIGFGKTRTQVMILVHAAMTKKDALNKHGTCVSFSSKAILSALKTTVKRSSSDVVIQKEWRGKKRKERKEKNGRRRNVKKESTRKS